MSKNLMEKYRNWQVAGNPDEPEHIVHGFKTQTGRIIPFQIIPLLELEDVYLLVDTPEEAQSMREAGAAAEPVNMGFKDVVFSRREIEGLLPADIRAHFLNKKKIMEKGKP